MVQFIQTYFEVVISFLTLFVASATAFFAYRQHRLEKTKLKLESYPRRLKVYDAINRFIADTLQSGTTDNEHLTEMLRETKRARFLFNKKDKITTYIDTIYKNGLDLEYKEEGLMGKLEKYSAEQRNKIVEERGKLFDWFKDQFRVVEEKFKPYLHL